MGEQRVALVTGASRGIGRAIAARLAREGRHVFLCARSEGPLRDLAASIEGDGGRASVRTCDMGDRAQVQAMVESVIEEGGRLDILVNNAGITRDNLLMRMSDEEWDEVMRVNLTSVFVACRAAARTMMRQRFGRIVNIGSTSGLVGNTGQANYAAAKSALVGFSRTLARELGSKGVTCNVVAPGFIQTDMTKDLPEEIVSQVKQAIAVRRLGEVEDIAACVSYVAGDEAGFLTGQVITVDGGMTMA